MQNPNPNTIKPSNRKFKIFYKWGVEICDVSQGHNFWIANFFAVNYISISLRKKFRFEYTKFMYGMHHRHLYLGPIRISWGFYNSLSSKSRYPKGKRMRKIKGSKK